MGTSTKVVGGKLEVTNTPVETKESFDRTEVVGKRAEAQTKVDHLKIDLAEAEAEVAKYDAYIVEIDK